MVRPSGRQHARDLLCKLASRDKDKATRRLLRGAAVHLGHAAEHRQPEGERLARPGLGPAEDVTAAQGIGQGARLDRERLADVASGERGDEPAVEAEFGEGLCWWLG